MRQPSNWTKREAVEVADTLALAIDLASSHGYTKEATLWRDASLWCEPRRFRTVLCQPALADKLRQTAREAREFSGYIMSGINKDLAK